MGMLLLLLFKLRLLRTVVCEMLQTVPAWSVGFFFSLSLFCPLCQSTCSVCSSGGGGGIVFTEDDSFPVYMYRERSFENHQFMFIINFSITDHLFHYRSRAEKWRSHVLQVYIPLLQSKYLMSNKAKPAVNSGHPFPDAG